MAEKKKLKSEASSSNSNDHSAADAADCSVVSDIGRRRSSCGYCRSAGHSSVSHGQFIKHGLWAYSLTVDDYQVLLDRGWRRSGCYLYKPEMERTCCPSYTIRLKAGEFSPSKEQLRVSKRMQRFLDGTLDDKRLEKSMDEPKGNLKNEYASQVSEKSRSVNNEEGKNKAEQLTQSLSHQIDVVIQEFVGRGELSIDLQLPKASVKIVPPAKRKLLVQESEQLVFTCNISFQIFAALRRAKKDYRPEVFSKSSAENNDQKTGLSPHKIADTLVEHLYQVLLSSNLLVRSCNGHINFYSTEKHDLDDIVKRGTALTERPESVLKKSAVNMSGKGRHLEIRLKRSSFDPEEYALYRKYQLEVHNDTPEHVSESSYQRFLVDSPLIFVPPTGDETVPSCGFGSFHQQYLIDGKLVAVGIIDILPKCLSSKYLFWDPDLAPLSLGKFSALQEIKWVSENQVRCPSLQYYYLGYYIHSCNKMRYKAAYRPSELLCPLRYQWIPFDIVKPLLDRKKYVVLSDYASSHSGESLTPTILDNQMEEEHYDLSDGGKNDTFVHQDDEMVGVDSDESDEDSDLELPLAAAAEDGDVGDVLIGMKSVRLRFKDVRQAFEPSGRRYVENQLQRYMRAVGAELSERMVYMFA